MPAPRTGTNDISIADRTDIAAALRLEYQLLRQQIAEADNACLLILGLLMTASLTIVGVGTQRATPAITWLLTPLWLVGYWYLCEKRFIILKTALYLRTVIETRHPGFGWESWNQHVRSGFVRFRPFYLESTIAGIAVALAPFLTAYTSSSQLTQPWLWLTIVGAVIFAITLTRTVRAYRAVPREASSPVKNAVDVDGSIDTSRPEVASK